MNTKIEEVLIQAVLLNNQYVMKEKINLEKDKVVDLLIQVKEAMDHIVKI